MLKIHKTATAAAILGLLFTTAMVSAHSWDKHDHNKDKHEDCPPQATGAWVAQDPLIGAWVINATLVQTDTTAPEFIAFGNVNFNIGGTSASMYSTDIQQPFADFGCYGTHGSGCWHKTHERCYKMVEVNEYYSKDIDPAHQHQGIPFGRLKREYKIKISKCGNYIKGKVTCTFYNIDSLKLNHDERKPGFPVSTTKFVGARVH